MKLSLLIVSVALFIFINGFQNPALFYIGYLWTSFLYPSAFATTVLPLSMIFGLGSLGGYLVLDKTIRGRLSPVFYLAGAFAVWITLTAFVTPSAQVPWGKWNWAVQSVIITIATPLLLRTRVQIETAFIATFSALSAHAMTGGIKTMLGTGGYDRLGRLLPYDFWLGETSTLAMATVISLPMGYYCIRRSIIFERYPRRLMDLAFAGYSIVAVMCMVGTSARTGVMSFATLLLFGIKGIVRKVVVITVAAGLFVLAQPYLPGRSMDRFGTIQTYQQDGSATTRLAVWKWAIRYTAEHPFGGGFGVFYTSDFDFQTKDQYGTLQTFHRHGAAAHSVYFEVLGEQGYPGIALFLAMMIIGMLGMWRISRLRLGDGDQWHATFARTLFACMVVFAVGASFVGIAFQPLLYTFLGFYCSLQRWVQVQRVAQAKISAKPKLFRAAAPSEAVA